jgi:hypothetical protein
MPTEAHAPVQCSVRLRILGLLCCVSLYTGAENLCVSCLPLCLLLQLDRDRLLLALRQRDARLRRVGLFLFFATTTYLPGTKSRISNLPFWSVTALLSASPSFWFMFFNMTIAPV